MFIWLGLVIFLWHTYWNITLFPIKYVTEFIRCIRYNGYAAPYNNAVRQLEVNREAHNVGSGVGTGPYYGVPDTGRYYGYYRFPRYGYPY